MKVLEKGPGLVDTQCLGCWRAKRETGGKKSGRVVNPGLNQLRFSSTSIPVEFNVIKPLSSSLFLLQGATTTTLLASSFLMRSSSHFSVCVFSDWGSFLQQNHQIGSRRRHGRPSRKSHDELSFNLLIVDGSLVPLHVVLAAAAYSFH